MTTLYDRLEQALGDPSTLGRAMVAANALLRRRLRPITYGELHAEIERRVPKFNVGVVWGAKLGAFIDYWAYTERVLGHASPAHMLVRETDSLPGTRLRTGDTEKDRRRAEAEQKAYIEYWRPRRRDRQRHAAEQRG